MNERRPGVVGWWLLLVGGGLFALGALLPWIHVSTVFGTLSRGALDGVGVLPLGAGVVLMACGAAGLARSAMLQMLFWFALVASLVGSGVAVYYGTMTGRWMSAANAEATPAAVLEVGSGLVLIGLAVLPAAAGVVLTGRVLRRPHQPAWQPALAAALLLVTAGVSGVSGAQESIAASHEASVGGSHAGERAGADAGRNARGDARVPGSRSSAPSGAREDGPTQDAPDEATGPADVPAALMQPAAEPVQEWVGEQGTEAVEPEPEVEEPPGEPSVGETGVTQAEPLRLSADPASGPYGQVITVTGAGWVAGSEVSILYESTGHITTALVDARGRFAATLRTEGDDPTPGRRTITAVAGEQQLQTSYDVTH